MIRCNAPYLKPTSFNRLGVICLWIVTSVLLIAGASQPAFGQSQPTLSLKSPYNGSLSESDLASSFANKPPLSNSKWDHEPCSIAYDWQASIRQSEANVQEFKDGIDAQISQLIAGGAFDAAEGEKRKAEAISSIETSLAAERAKAANHLKNIPKCKGMYYRPAVEETCTRRSMGKENAFCAALEGAALEGVSFSDDKLGMGRAIAWNYNGGLNDGNRLFGTQKWAPSQSAPYTEPGPDPERYGVYLFYYLEIEQLEKERAADLNAVMKSGIPYIQASSFVYDSSTGKEWSSQYGSWYFNVEMVRGKRSDVSIDGLTGIKSLSAATGLSWDMGEFVQYPQLHFQARIYDLLVQQEYVEFYVADSQDKMTRLSSLAAFETPDENTILMGSSWQSYSIHASMVPSAEDWALIRSPNSKMLYAVTEITLEDGSIDRVSIPMPLDGFEDSLSVFAASQAEVSKFARTVSRKWNDKIEALERKRDESKKAFYAKQQSEALALVAENPFYFSCNDYPSSPMDADTNNKLMQKRRSCESEWSRHASDILSRLKRYESDLVLPEHAPALARVQQAREQWEKQYKTNRQQLADYNERTLNTNRRIAAANSQTEPSAARNSQSGASKYSSARQRARDRRGNDKPERDYASEFYESQRNPTTYFKAPPPPNRRPPTYFRPGYY